jgi:hypothetical protein
MMLAGGLMHGAKLFPDSEMTHFPKQVWLELTEIILNIAYAAFALSKKLHCFGMLEWLGIRLLRLAARALGHAPAEQHVEFRADLPVQI